MENIKSKVSDMEIVEDFLGFKGRFKGDMVELSISDLAERIRKFEKKYEFDENVLIEYHRENLRTLGLDEDEINEAIFVDGDCGLQYGISEQLEEFYKWLMEKLK